MQCGAKDRAEPQSSIRQGDNHTVHCALSPQTIWKTYPASLVAKAQPDGLVDIVKVAKAQLAVETCVGAGGAGRKVCLRGSIMFTRCHAQTVHMCTPCF